jgi:glycosyltransferase involved in cell wall biosynthesis
MKGLPQKGSTVMDKEPRVSVIMPVRNEEDFIRRSLGSVLGQDYPPEKIDVVIVDGMSTDDTRQVIREMAEQAPRVSVDIYDNPEQIVPPAMNIGIRQAEGDYIVRVDGHCELPPGYIRKAVEVLEREQAQNVGGMQYPVGETYISRAVALATSSPYFIGNSYFRFAEKQRYVDTVYLGVYPREIFDVIGMFDEELVRHQDYDLNLRLRNRGYRILYVPELKVRYYPRSSIPSFFKQYFEYGFWKVRVMQKSERAFQLRHFPPTLLVLGLVLGGILSLLIPWLRALYLLGLGAYLALALGSSLLVSFREGEWKYLPVLPILFACIHIGWGAGFWWGVIKWNLWGSSSRG